MFICQVTEDRCPMFLRTRRDARIVRLADEVLWIAPAGDAERVVAIAREDWARVHASCPGLAAFDVLPRARRRDLLTAWLADAPQGARVADGAAAVALVREKLVAADGMDPAEAVAAVASLVAWAEQAPEGFVTGRLVAHGGADIRTLYFDTRPTADWRALARLSHSPPTPRTHDTSEYEVSPSRGMPERETEMGWAFAFAPGFALDARALSAEEAEAARAAREACAPRWRDERQLTFSFFASPLCDAK